MTDKCINKITNNKDKFIIFFSEWCRYSMDAIDLLKQNKYPFKGYKIDKINGGMQRLLNAFKKNKKIIKFNEHHSTRPIIFYNGKFIGGLQELKEFTDNELVVRD